MSYQGYIQVLCKNGHHEELHITSWDDYKYVFSPEDVREDYDTPLWKCPHCGELAVWTNQYSIWWQEHNDSWQDSWGEFEYEGPVALSFAEPPVYKVPEFHGRRENEEDLRG